MATNIRPLHDRVIVRRIDDEWERGEGGSYQLEQVM